MKFTKITLNDKNSQRVYDNYITSVETAVKPLPQEDKLDVLMEFNSHIYESLQSKSKGTEMERLLDAIDRLGTPAEVLKPLVADKLLDKATKTFNPIHVFKALLYNIANGLSYVLFAVLYLFLFTFVILIVAKAFNSNVGMYVQDGNTSSFTLGLIDNTDGYTEVLGYWFIPIMLLAAVALYFMITYLLRYKRSQSQHYAMKTILTSLALLCTITSGYSQQHDYSKLDSFFGVLEAHERFWGSIAVVQGGQPVYHHSIGYADIEGNVSNSSETKFKIGSITKTFTAVLILRAVEHGHINLDDTIDGYFPEITNADKITIKHLLNHRSGIHNFTDSESFFDWNMEPISRPALLDTITDIGIDFEPDSKMSYSNSNYVLLTWILEDVFKMPYNALLGKYFSVPLGLDHTKVGGKINPAHSEAYSYENIKQGTKSDETDPSVTLGAGHIISTPSDLCVFIHSLFQGELITMESLDLMRPEDSDLYGLGLFTFPFYEHIGLGHTGGIDAFSSTLAYYEEDEVCFALTSNGRDYNNNDITIAVLSQVFDRPYDIPVFNEIVDLSSAELDQYLCTYAASELPIDLKVYKKGKILYAQGTGQPAFALAAEGNHVFTCQKIGLKLKFTPEDNSLLLEQGSGKFHMICTD